MSLALFCKYEAFSSQNPFYLSECSIYLQCMDHLYIRLPLLILTKFQYILIMVNFFIGIGLFFILCDLLKYKECPLTLFCEYSVFSQNPFFLNEWSIYLQYMYHLYVKSVPCFVLNKFLFILMIVHFFTGKVLFFLYCVVHFYYRLSLGFIL